MIIYKEFLTRWLIASYLCSIKINMAAVLKLNFFQGSPVKVKRQFPS